MIPIFDLRTAPWLPFRRRNGAIVWAAPSALTDSLANDPIVAIAAPRPDFDGALLEFLIGLYTAAFAPSNEAEWRRIWKEPPEPSAIAVRLATLPDAFALDGNGPRFMQDYDAAELGREAAEPIQELLVNAKNSNLFVKPGQVHQMSRSTAAMALITMQSYSTAGGRGWRTSVRGGGPLTTIIDPRRIGDEDTPLWEVVWANVETVTQLGVPKRGNVDDARPEQSYPWLAATRTSKSDKDVVTPDSAHPLQAYFGMPRRIRLEFSDTIGLCDVSGQSDDRMVTGFRGKAYGVNYNGWTHPLSPYYAGKEPGERLPLHGQPGGVSWRDWLSLLHSDQKNGDRSAASTVANFSGRAERIDRPHYSLRVFGYDAAQAKIREWVETRLPAFADLDDDRLNIIRSSIASLAEATDKAAFVLQKAVMRALYASGDDTPGDFGYVKAELWRATAPWFYTEIETFVGASELRVAGADVKKRFRNALDDAAQAIFDRLAPSDVTHPDVLKRTIGARLNLVLTLRGVGKVGAGIYQALGLEPPGEKRQRAAPRVTKTKERKQP